MADDSELQARSSARLGTTLRGKYRLDRVIGIGGMAVVFAATHRNLKKFAVKMLHAELSIREDIRTRFLREGYAANSLEHPGAVAVLDDDVAEDGSAFLVMELLEGDDLESLWEKNGSRLPPRVVLCIGYQLLDILAAAHARGIVHRDIKPPNLFVNRDGTLKVLDFGIARVRDAVASGAKHTGTGMLLGTPAFMAPEQALAMSSEINGQTDVWAAGATMFTLLSGALVHEGDNAAQLLVKAATTQARSVASVAPSTPTGLVQVVDRAIAFDKAARWDSAEGMRDAIRDEYFGMFGDEVSRAPLAELFQRPSQPFTPTQHSGPLGPEGGASRSPPPGERLSREAPPPSAFAPSPPAHTVGAGGFAPSARTSAPTTRSVPGGTLQAGATPAGAYTAGSTVGMSTSKPVSSDGPVMPYGVPGRRRASSAVYGAVAAAAVAVIGFATFELRGRSPSGEAARPPPADSVAVATTSAPAATPETPPTSSRPPASTATASAAPATAQGEVSPVTRASDTAAIAVSALPRVSRVAPSARPAVAAAPALNCDPPYTLDDKGQRHYKPECYLKKAP